MSAVGSVSAGAAFAAQALPKKSLSRVPEMAFGKAKWEKYFGDIGDEPPLPENIEEILNSSCPFWPDKKVKETHLLVLIPETVNGKLFHLDSLREIIQAPNAGHKAKYRHYHYDVKKELGKKGEKSHWVLTTRNVIPGSRDKSYKAQKALAEKDAGRNGVAYKMPKALEAATAILMEHVSTGARLYGDDPWTYTRCQEKVNKSGCPVAIGALSCRGLDVSQYFSCATGTGVGACGSLGAWE